jgi:hypothetical protein
VAPGLRPAPSRGRRHRQPKTFRLCRTAIRRSPRGDARCPGWKGPAAPTSETLFPSPLADAGLRHLGPQLHRLRHLRVLAAISARRDRSSGFRANRRSTTRRRRRQYQHDREDPFFPDQRDGIGYLSSRRTQEELLLVSAAAVLSSRPDLEHRVPRLPHHGLRGPRKGVDPVLRLRRRLPETIPRTSPRPACGPFSDGERVNVAERNRISDGTGPQRREEASTG